MNKAQRRISNLKHDVYKAFDSCGALLYVGCSVNVFKRLREHKHYALWLLHTERIDVVQYANRSEALAEEARCIRFDHPTFNVTAENAYGCKLPTESLDSFTLRMDSDGWYIDGEG